jgi:methanogenic corrinoid protein MtbC1
MEEAGIRNKVITLVGGAPTTEEWAKEIGADGWAPNAALAVERVKMLLETKQNRE